MQATRNEPISRIGRRFQPLPFRARLSERQSIILHLLAAGKSIRTIARQLHISDKTVYEHLQRVKEQTGLSSLFQLGLWFAEVRYASTPVDADSDVGGGSLPRKPYAGSSRP
jgi:DNA-binding NarL/FixJ family response regulator